MIFGLGRDGQLAQPVEGVEPCTTRAPNSTNEAGSSPRAGECSPSPAVADSVRQARELAYEGASLVTFEGRVMRNDIRPGRDLEECHDPQVLTTRRRRLLC